MARRRSAFVAMVVVGGATRLTESGLSITEWKPVTGVLPPLNEADWRKAFAKYQQIPQYLELIPRHGPRAVQDHLMPGNGAIACSARMHRPAFRRALRCGFWRSGRLKGRLRGGLAGICALGAARRSSAGGWCPRASVDRVEVAQERLAIHLLLAAATFAALIWTAVGLVPNCRERLAGARGFASRARRSVALVSWFRSASAALVAGLRAGLVYNSWPLMDGRFIRRCAHLFNLTPWFANFLENVTLVQFQHRITANLLLALALYHASYQPGNRRAAGRAAGRPAARVVLVQAGLGIATLVAGRSATGRPRAPGHRDGRAGRGDHPSPQARLKRMRVKLAYRD